MNTEEDFKKVLNITEQEWQQIMTYSQDSTDENTPEGFVDQRITIDVITEDKERDILSFDLVYTAGEECEYGGYEPKEFSHVIVYE